MNARKALSALSFTSVLALSSLLGSTARASSPALPPLPGAGAPAVAPNAATAADPGSTTAPAGTGLTLDRVTRGIVTLERDGRLLGVGTVLSGDGRVLTALSDMGSSDNVDVRYVDGTLVHAKVGHRDKTWDLALLVPLSGKWTEGLTASEVDPAATELRAFVAARPGHPAVVPAHLRGTIEARAREGADPLSALDVEIKVTPSYGSPITDAQGGVVGVLVRACKAAPGGPCSPLGVTAPVTAVRQFLVHTPVTAVAPSPWLGIVGEPDASGNTRGVRVMAIAPQSPADRGGLKANADRSLADIIVAVDGQPVETPERLAELISKHSIGETVKLLVLSKDKFHDLNVTLRAASP